MTISDIQDMNRLLAYLRSFRVVDLVDEFYRRQHNNPAPSTLLKEEVDRFAAIVGKLSDMTDLGRIKSTYDECGISYVVRETTQSHQQFLFVIRESDRSRFMTGELEYLLRVGKYIEFIDGKLGSY